MSSSSDKQDEQDLWGTKDAAALAAVDMVTPFPLGHSRKGAGSTAARTTLQWGGPQLEDPGEAMGASTTASETSLIQGVKLSRRGDNNNNPLPNLAHLLHVTAPNACDTPTHRALPRGDNNNNHPLPNLAL